MVPAPMPTMPSSGPASATPLLGESGRAASPLSPAPVLLAFPPVALVGFFVPLTPVMCLPLGRCLTTPSCPRRRGHGVVADGDLENGRRHVHGVDAPPRTVPARPDVPAIVRKDPVLMSVEKYVRRGTRRIVDGHSWNDQERGRTRELNAD